jgi:type I restriction enzyme M protein
VLTNRGTEYVRDWLGQSAKVRAIVSLPIVTFVPFGANVKTSVLFLKKWERGEVRTTCYPVCLVRIDGVGYDANGRPNATRDIEEATAALKAFFSREGW